MGAHGHNSFSKPVHVQAVPPHARQKALVTLDGDILCMSHCPAAVGHLRGVVGELGVTSHAGSDVEVRIFRPERWSAGAALWLVS